MNSAETLSRRDRAFAIDVNREPFNGIDGDIVLDDQALRQGFYNLIIGYVGCKSRIFGDLAFGSQTYNFLQEPIDAQTAAKIQASLHQAVTRWEPRAVITPGGLVVTPDPSIPGFHIRITYTNLATGRVGSATFNLNTSAR